MHKYSCYLIGEDHLILECARILIENNFKIFGIISNFSPVVEWALKNNILNFSADKNLDSVLNKRFDYLISAVNSKILTRDILALARKMNINFHNAPLPMYAGVHAISWAILNDEKQYGITWHEMTSKIDGGDILEQSFFPINEEETALSLSIKCYEKAISAFETLVQRIQNGSIQKTPQNLSMRSYYDLQKKPKGMGLIQWNNSAQDIQRICRAFSLGHYSDNTFVSAKFILDNQLIIVTKPPSIGEKSTAPSGTIKKHTPNALQISTGSNDLIFSNLYYINQKNTQDSAWIHSRPYVARHTEIEAYDNLGFINSHNERFWVKEINEFIPEPIPFQPILKESISSSYKKICSYSLELSVFEGCNSILEHNIDNIIFTILMIYISKVASSNNISVKLKNQSANTSSFLSKLLFSEYVPFNIVLDDQKDFVDSINLISKKLHCLSKKGAFEYDVFFRYPNISNNFLNQESIAILFNNKGHDNLKNLNENISVIINKEKKTIAWYLDNDLIGKNKNLYQTIKLFPGRIDALISSISSNINRKLSELAILSVNEKNWILNNFRLDTSDYPRNKSVIELFEEVVQSNPNKIAISDAHISLAYSKLNNFSNYLSDYLVSSGLGPGKYAAICANNEISTVICMIAVLKTGAAYIPINNNYPVEHIKNILQDANPLLFLTNQITDSKMHKYCDELNVKIIIYDDYLKKYTLKALKNQNHSATPDSLAYVIYTSGTTGKPKGVMVNNRAIIRLVRNTNYIQIKKTDAIAQAASIGFDAATFEIWGALLNGSKLVVIPSTILLNINKFSRILDKEKINILWLTSPLFNQYAFIKKSLFKNIKYLLVGGDILNPEMIFGVLEHQGGHPKNIINGYGPTENTTFTTTYKVTRRSKGLKSIPIGKGISNTSIYVLDKALDLVPIGVSGELYTGGDGLALGYLNNASLTEKKFILNPIPIYKNERIYKTGDIVRWMPDGNIDYIGREDNQIKINGFRIETEGIQNNILQHNRVKQCFVTLLEDDKKIKVLIAYLVCKGVLTPESIQKYLSKRLPSYMIPKAFIFVKSLPLTVNGKIDKHKLPIPIISRNHSNLVPPKTQTQQKIKTLWEEIFAHDQIGITDNFFNVGGHSLLLTHLVIKLKDIFEFDLPVHKFLENPTIEALETLILNKDIRSMGSNNSLIYDDLNQNITIPLQMQGGEPYVFKNVFLTGCTGFLGAHILSDLCQQSTVEKVYCLVRSENMKRAKESVIKTIEKYCLKVNKAKIYPVVGDLSLKNLGLSQNEFIKLSKNIDLIIHNGAKVNHIMNYETLRATNVSATNTLINLASASKIKPIHFVSTLSAACNHLKNNKIKETLIELDANEGYPRDGYSQTKWVSELLLSKAQKLGLPIKIYRPGWIVGHSQSGIMAAENNHLYSLIKGCIQLKFAPMWDMVVNLMPVDIVSGFIVSTSLFDRDNTIFNLIHTSYNLKWENLFNYLKYGRNYNIELIPDKLWSKSYLQKITYENALYPIYSLYVNNDSSEWTKDLSKITQAYCNNTKKLMKKNGLIVKNISEKTLDIHFNYLERVGFLS